MPESILKSHFGLSKFRQGQREIIDYILNGQSVIGTMPTGSGKSLCYQLPALMVDGVTIVVSPLIALMKDQVDALSELGIPATFINSTLSWNDILDRFAEIKKGSIPLVYVAPERFYSNSFLDLIKSVEVSHFIVDEAHCISQWGHDFRPSYLRLKEAIHAVGNPPVGAFTATATPEVRRDIRLQLGIDDAKEIVTGFDRSNLKYVAVSLEKDKEKDKELLRILPTIMGTGIIYVGTQKLVTKQTDLLISNGYNASGYHGGMEKSERDKAQNDWITGKVPIMVATNAFGMGIDKPDVRFVIHYTMPGTVEAYYQESGRAGRDGKTSYCVVFSGYSDIMLQEFFIDNAHPPKEVILDIYDFLFSLNRQDIYLTHKEIAQQIGGVNQMMVGSVLAILEKANLVKRLNRSQHFMEIEVLPVSEAVKQVKSSTQQGVLLRELRKRITDPNSPTVKANPEVLSKSVNLTRTQLGTALLALENKGFIHYTPPFRGRGVRIISQQMPHSQLPIDFDAIDNHRNYQMKQLETMKKYVSSGECRRRFLLKYFGERYHSDNCRGCDICLKWRPPVKSTEKSAPTGRSKTGRSLLTPKEANELTFDILNVVHEWDGEFGKDMFAKILSGSRSKRLSHKLRSSDWYGRYKHITKKIISHTINQLEKNRYLFRTNGLYPTLTLSEKGKSVLDGNNPLPEKIAENITGGYHLDKSTVQLLESNRGQNKKKPVIITDTVLRTKSLYESGMGMEEMVRVRELKTSTIADHLCRLSEAGLVVDIKRFVPPEKIAAIRKAINKTSTFALRAIMDSLNENSPDGVEYSYYDIKLVLYCTEPNTKSHEPNFKNQE